MSTRRRRTWRERVRRPVRLGVLTVAGLSVALAGCSTDDGSDPAIDLLFSPDATPTDSASPSPTPSVAVGLPEFPDDCAALVPATDVAAVLAVPLPGDTTFVFADELPDIGRVARVTCGYGVGTGRGPGPAVEITVNEYESQEAAQSRIELTLQAAAERGNEVSEQGVGPYEGWVISDRRDVSLVVDAGERTLVVTVKRGLVDAAAEPVVLTQLAGRALGVPMATVEPPSP
jgi:hypothetical protein